MTRHSSIRLGTRTSALARWQADWVADRLRESGVEVELVLITTEGDVKQGPLGQIGGQGLFTKQIQQALLDERIDLAVHSLKDLPTEQVGGLALAASAGAGARSHRSPASAASHRREGKRLREFRAIIASWPGQRPGPVVQELATG